MPSRYSIPVLAFLCLSLMLSESCMTGAAEGTGVPPRVDPMDRLLEGEQAAPLSEAEEERAVSEQLDKLRANPRERRRLIMVAQMLLGRFGYGVGPFDGRFDDKTRRAIKYYQESNRLPATGELDVQTFTKLMDDSDWLEQLSVQLPPHLFGADTWDRSVSAGGTWAIVNGHQSMPLQTTNIECNRKWNSCIVSTSMVGEGNQLVLTTDDYEVERWDDQEIVTKPKSIRCAAETLRLSRSQKTVTRLRTTSPSEPCQPSEGGRDVTLHLESGVKVWTELNNARRDRFRRVMKTGDFSFEDVKE